MPKRVGHELELDVPAALDVLLQVEPGVAEGLLRLERGLLEAAGEASASSRQTRIPLPPPPAVALSSTGKPISRRKRQRLARRRRSRPRSPGTTGSPGAFIVRRAVALSPISADHPRRRADEGQLALAAQLGEQRVLGEEAVAGVDGLGLGLLGGLQDRRHVEVALARSSAPPMQTRRSACARCGESASASE